MSSVGSDSLAVQMGCCSSISAHTTHSCTAQCANWHTRQGSAGHCVWPFAVLASVLPRALQHPSGHCAPLGEQVLSAGPPGHERRPSHVSSGSAGASRACRLPSRGRGHWGAAGSRSFGGEPCCQRMKRLPICASYFATSSEPLPLICQP